GTRGDIERAAVVAAGAAGVDRAGRRLDLHHLGPHGAHGAGQLRHRLAAHAQRHKEAADLRRRRIAGHQDVEGLRRLVLVEGAPGGDGSEQRLEVGHATALLGAFSPASRRKFPRRRWPCSEAMLSGWNCTPWIGSVLWATPMIKPFSVSAVTSRQSGRLSRATTRE